MQRATEDDLAKGRSSLFCFDDKYRTQAKIQGTLFSKASKNLIFALSDCQAENPMAPPGFQCQSKTKRKDVRNETI